MSVEKFLERVNDNIDSLESVIALLKRGVEKGSPFIDGKSIFVLENRVKELKRLTNEDKVNSSFSEYSIRLYEVELKIRRNLQRFIVHLTFADIDLDEFATDVLGFKQVSTELATTIYEDDAQTAQFAVRRSMEDIGVVYGGVVFESSLQAMLTIASKLAYSVVF